jgi:hypothetical protein
MLREEWSSSGRVVTECALTALHDGMPRLVSCSTATQERC